MKPFHEQPADNAPGGPAANDGLSWFCLQSKPQKERYAETHLIRQGCEVFLPLARVRKMSGDRPVLRVCPLFPRYLFLRQPADAGFSSIRSTRGVASVVSFGGKAAPVPDAVVDEIQRRCTDGIVEFEEPELAAGSPVRILGGPYRGMEAIFQRETSDQDRVIVLLEIMASVAQVSIDRNFLESC